MKDDVDLPAIKARCDKATPITTWGGAEWGVTESNDGPGQKPTFCVGINGIGHWPIGWVYRAEDADFIAHARQDVPALLNALTSAIGRESANNRAYQNYIDATAQQRDEAIIAQLAAERRVAELEEMLINIKP